MQDKNKTQETKWDEDDDDDEYRCGVGSCKPDCIQPFATDKAYMISYGFLSLLQGMLWSYLIAVLTTIEKRFAISSKASGFSMTGAEYSNILGALFVTYFGSQGHRPRWISVGMYMCAFSCFFLALPEWILPGNTAVLTLYANASSQDICLAKNNSILEEEICHDKDDLTFSNSSSLTATALLFLGMFINGFGGIPLYTLAWTFMDDSVPKKNLPLYLGMTMSIRSLGPAFGYILGGFTLQIYHDVNKTPDFDNLDPRWVGAWWLGFVCIGAALCILSFTMYMFPRELPNQRKKKLNLLALNKNEEKTVDSRLKAIGLPSLKDLPKALKSILTNRLFMATIFEGVVYWLGLFGFIIFLPKYMESHFGASASSASFITGLTNVSVMMVGFMLSGFVIHRLQPRARTLSAFSMVTGLTQVVLLLVSMSIACEENVQLHGTLLSDKILNINEDCNFNCQCTTEKYTPVCDISSGVTFFSACHTGCLNYNETTETYSNCACSSPTNFTQEPIIQTGKCPTTCSTFIQYIAMLALIRFLSSTERIGGTIIFLRAVKPSERSLGLGVANIFFCLIAFIPCSVLFGTLIDTTCLVWEEDCEGYGNCWFYDTDRFRYWLHGFSAGLLLISNSFQLYIWFHAKHLKLYEETVEDIRTDLNDEKCIKNGISPALTNNEESLTESQI